MQELKRAEKRGHCVLGNPKPVHINLLLICFFLVSLLLSVLVYQFYIGKHKCYLENIILCWRGEE